MLFIFILVSILDIYINMSVFLIAYLLFDFSSNQYQLIQKFLSFYYKLGSYTSNPPKPHAFIDSPLQSFTGCPAALTAYAISVGVNCVMLSNGLWVTTTLMFYDEITGSILPIMQVLFG
jgi:hypothetical protein